MAPPRTPPDSPAQPPSPDRPAVMRLPTFPALPPSAGQGARPAPAPPDGGSGAGGAAEATVLGLVEAEFFVGESPLGLVIDWSMALPVVSGVLPGSPASGRASLRAGLVLLAADRRQLLPGMTRAEVESLLVCRPLALVFETLDPKLIGDSAPAALRLRTPAPPAPLALVKAARAPQGLASGLGKTLSLFERCPERIPLSRFGNLDLFSERCPVSLGGHREDQLSPVSPMSPSEQRRALLAGGGRSGRQPARIAQRPAMSQQLPQLPRFTGGDTPSPLSQTWSGGLSAGRRGDGNWRQAGLRAACDTWPSGEAVGRQPGAGSRSLPARTRKGESRSTTCLGAEVRKPDPSYDHLASDGARTCGPGPPARWPLGHENEYVCRLVDLVLVAKPLHAYEAGFMGSKRDRPSDWQVKFLGTGASPRAKHVTKVEEVWCDMCGTFIASWNSTGLAHFYFCKRCKKNGNRFEMCLACHASEVLQAEGKHTGRTQHPHFLRCEHRSLVRCKNLLSAYPGSPHVRRAFCDHCGHLIADLGTTAARDRSPRTSSGASARCGGEIYACPRCPEDYGLRFELCETCAVSMLELGVGIQRLEACK